MHFCKLLSERFLTDDSLINFQGSALSTKKWNVGIGNVCLIFRYIFNKDECNHNYNHVTSNMDLKLQFVQKPTDPLKCPPVGSRNLQQWIPLNINICQVGLGIIWKNDDTRTNTSTFKVKQIPTEYFIRYSSCEWKHSVAKKANTPQTVWVVAVAVVGHSHVALNWRTVAVIGSKKRHRNCHFWIN